MGVHSVRDWTVMPAPPQAASQGSWSDGESAAPPSLPPPLPPGTAANLANVMEMIIIPSPARFTSSRLQGY